MFEDAQTTDGNLVYTASGNSGVKISISNGVVIISSSNEWYGFEAVIFTVEDESGLTVNDEVIFVVNEPFTGIAISIPGKIEGEDYDLGGEGVAFHETNVQWDPTNIYRTDDVDIESLSNSNYSIGYVRDGEWLEYTVNVSTSGIYKFHLRTASLNRVN